MKKNLVLLALIIGIFFFSFASVSAMNFDNVKKYDADTQKVTIKNAFGLPLIGDTIAEITLDTPVKNKVARGYGKVAEMTFVANDDFRRWFADMELYDVKSDMQTINKKLDFKFLTYENVSINIYENQCTNNNTCVEIIIGNYTKIKEKWIDLSEYNFKKGDTIIIGIFTDVQPGEKVEWIPTFYGKRIIEWATWEESLFTNLDLFYKFDETSGTEISDYQGNYTGTAYNTEDSDWESGVIGNAFHINEGTFNEYIDTTYNPTWTLTDNFTISFWMKHEDPTISLAGVQRMGSESGTSDFLLQKNGGGGTSWRWRIIAGATTNYNINADLSTSAFRHIVLVRDVGSDQMRTYVDGVSVNNDTDGSTATIDLSSYSLWLGASNNVVNTGLNVTIDLFGIWSRSLTQSEITDLYNGGAGLQPEMTPGLNATLISPENNTYYNISNIEFIGYLISENAIANVSLIINDTYIETNSSGLNNTNYNFNQEIAEGIHTWTYEVCTTDNTCSNASERWIVGDFTNPVVENLSINQSGEIFGYPKPFNISVNASDTNLASCFGNLDGGSNVSLNCNSGTNVGTIEEGSHTYYAWANDSAGNIGGPTNLSFSIDYYTHNVTFRDLLDNSIVTPSCSFLGENYTSYDYKFDIHETASRNVSCYLLSYGYFNFTLDESNFTSQNVSVSPAMLNLSFDQNTNVSLIWLGGGLNFTNVANVTIPMRNLSTGEIQVNFNGETQLYSFYNDQDTSYSDGLHLETVDFDQPVKVLASSQEINDALVTFKKSVGSNILTTYSAFTNINGLAHILVNDGTSYEVYIEKEGYDTYSELTYIPISNTDTLIINLIPEEGNTGEYYFSQSCLNVIGTEQNCSWYVKSYKDTNITFNYTWNGNNYSVVSSGSEATLTLISNSTTTPIYVTASVNPTKSYSVLWSGLSSRSIQLDFDDDEIKDETNGILVLFYAIVFILGILIMVSVNRIPKMKGSGIWGMVIWFGIIALEFPLLWFIVVPTLIYAIFKTFWGNEE